MLRIGLRGEKSKGRHHGKKSKKSVVALTDVMTDDQSCQEAEAKQLEKLVFGGDDEILAELAGKSDPVSEEYTPEAPKRIRKAVWNDEDDTNIVIESNTRGLQKEEAYAEKLRNNLVDRVGKPKWADLDHNTKEDSDDSDDDLLKTSRNLLSSSRPLVAGSIDIHSCRDLNNEGWSKGIIKSVKFHPTSQVALVANCNGTATLYQVDGKTNPKIQAVHFERFSLESADFTVDGEHIVVGSPEKNHFYYYDMMIGKIVKVPWAKGIEHCSTKRQFLSPNGKYLVICGRFGEMHLLTVKSKEWVGSLKMNGDVQAVAFNKDGSQMFSHGDNGEVYVWEMNSRRCLFKFQDEGCIQGTAVALSSNGQYFATGSDSGVVNIYHTSDVYKSRNPKPLKAILNLTTEISALKFNHTSEILAMASSYKDNAIKLVHVPTTTVFSNFPPIGHNHLRRVGCLDISLNSGYLALGNNIGRATLYRLKHFGNY